MQGRLPGHSAPQPAGCCSGSWCCWTSGSRPLCKCWGDPDPAPQPLHPNPAEPHTPPQPPPTRTHSHATLPPVPPAGGAGIPGGGVRHAAHGGGRGGAGEGWQGEGRSQAAHRRLPRGGAPCAGSSLPERGTARCGGTGSQTKAPAPRPLPLLSPVPATRAAAPLAPLAPQEAEIDEDEEANVVADWDQVRQDLAPGAWPAWDQVGHGLAPGDCLERGQARQGLAPGVCPVSLPRAARGRHIVWARHASSTRDAAHARLPGSVHNRATPAMPVTALDGLPPLRRATRSRPTTGRFSAPRRRSGAARKQSASAGRCGGRATSLSHPPFAAACCTVSGSPEGLLLSSAAPCLLTPGVAAPCPRPISSSPCLLHKTTTLICESRLLHVLFVRRRSGTSIWGWIPRRQPRRRRGT